MPRLTPERKAEIREWLTTPRLAVQPPLGYEIDALLNEVEALRAKLAAGEMFCRRAETAEAELERLKQVTHE